MIYLLFGIKGEHKFSTLKQYIENETPSKFSTPKQYIGMETPSFLVNLVQFLFLFFTFSILYEISDNNATAGKLRNKVFEGL